MKLRGNNSTRGEPEMIERLVLQMAAPMERRLGLASEREVLQASTRSSGSRKPFANTVWT
jgi:hypothetical protein